MILSVSKTKTDAALPTSTGATMTTPTASSITVNTGVSLIAPPVSNNHQTAATTSTNTRGFESQGPHIETGMRYRNTDINSNEYTGIVSRDWRSNEQWSGGQLNVGATPYVPPRLQRPPTPPQRPRYLGPSNQQRQWTSGNGFTGDNMQWDEPEHRGSGDRYGFHDRRGRGRINVPNNFGTCPRLDNYQPTAGIGATRVDKMLAFKKCRGQRAVSSGYDYITYSEVMRDEMMARFIPSTYEDESFAKLQTLRQGRSQSVDDYASDFYMLSSRVVFIRVRGATGSTVITLLPGSRLQEVTRMLPIFSKTLGILKDSFTELTTIIPVAPSQCVEEYVSRSVQTWPVRTILIPGESPHLKYDAFSASRAALSTSGTAVLELQLARLPCVIAYRAHFLTEWFIRFKAKISHISLPNILLDSSVIPEVLFQACTPENLATSLKEVIHVEALRAKQIIAAEKVLSFLCRSQGTFKDLIPKEINSRVSNYTPSMIAAFTILYLVKRR
ncbi:hypothetical protein GIB67_032798 [Kingdonia uniflora]|uniref:lipid-A-disaccharide synthase n=1 Tax=Kingdonia uniflora TaxID=39325 RepID=A0A7J7MW72_9MAGN|nr:hypothetical protein GIB67_032798 [Kingdonia uniflora]